MLNVKLALLAIGCCTGDLAYPKSTAASIQCAASIFSHLRLVVLINEIASISVPLLDFSMTEILSYLLALTNLLRCVLIEVFIDETVVVEGLVSVSLSHRFLIACLILSLI